MNQEKNQFRLEIRKERLSPMKIDVIDCISVGHDPRNDLVLMGKKIQPRHLIFEVKGENLALHYKGLTNQTFLNNLPLEEGKTYLVEAGDVIELFDAQITILQEVVSIHETQNIKPIILNSKKLFDEVVPEIRPESSLYEKRPEIKPEATLLEPIRIEKVKKTRVKIDFSYLIQLWQIKVYSIVVDIFFTYLFLVIALPLLYVNQYAQDILTFISVNFLHQKHSFMAFLIAWYILSFSQTLVFGSTIGQFLLGLRHQTSNAFGKLILARIKTLLFSLFLLPAQNSFKESLPYRAIRKIGMVIILFAILLSPFFLPSPYNSQVTLIEESQLKKELHTQTITSTSKDLEMSLAVELPFKYLLLPNVENDSKERSFIFIDLKSSQSITVTKKGDLTFKELQSKLEYANPFFSTIQRQGLEEMSLKSRKEIFSRALLLSPKQLKHSTRIFGPFFGSVVLLKNELLKKTPESGIVMKAYRPEVPLLFISSTQQDFFYLFEKERLSRYEVKGINQKALAEAFEQIVLSKLITNPEGLDDFNDKKVSILEAQDAFLHGDEKTILTYYTAIARSLGSTKMVYEDVDLTSQAKLALKDNITTILKFIKDKNIDKSLNDIKNQLTPMEKPGEKR